MSNNIDDWLPETGKPNIVKLVYVFFIAKMLAATQDIAVDGWALTMLKKLVLFDFIRLRLISQCGHFVRIYLDDNTTNDILILYRNNVGYASTCQSSGQVMGIMISSVMSVLFTSENFCNKYLRFTPAVGGIVSMRSE